MSVRQRRYDEDAFPRHEQAVASAVALVLVEKDTRAATALLNGPDMLGELVAGAFIAIIRYIADHHLDESERQSVVDTLRQLAVSAAAQR